MADRHLVRQCQGILRPGQNSIMTRVIDRQLEMGSLGNPTFIFLRGSFFNIYLYIDHNIFVPLFEFNISSGAASCWDNSYTLTFLYPLSLLFSPLSHSLTDSLPPFQRLPLIIPHSPLPLPRPRPAAHPLAQTPGVFNRHPAAPLRYAPHAVLHHRPSKQLPAVADPDSQFFACGDHRVVLPFELEVAFLAALGAEERPGAADRPVAERTVAGEAQGAGRERGGVVEEVAD